MRPGQLPARRPQGSAGGEELSPESSTPSSTASSAVGSPLVGNCPFGARAPRGKLRELKYRAWRELDTRRTSLVRGGLRAAHTRAEELASDVLAVQVGTVSLRQTTRVA